jgi:hypothetical protein
MLAAGPDPQRKRLNKENDARARLGALDRFFSPDLHLPNLDPAVGFSWNVLDLCSHLLVWFLFCAGKRVHAGPRTGFPHNCRGTADMIRLAVSEN